MFENLQATAVAFLVGMSQLIGVGDIPSISTDGWRVVENWSKEGEYHKIKLSSDMILKSCHKDKNGYIKFPVIIHGAHRIFADGKLVESFGDPHFKRTRSFYGAPILSCEKVASFSYLDWEVFSYTKYFARFSSYPSFRESRPWTIFINETVNAVAAGGLLLMSLFSFIISFGKIANNLVFSLCLSYIALSGYFFFGAPQFFGIDISMLSAHRIADICVWVGLTLIVYTFTLLSVVPKVLFHLFCLVVIPAVTIVCLGSTGDQVQFGTSLPFGMTLFVFLYGLFKQVHCMVSTKDRMYLLRSLGLTFWCVSVINDILVVAGLYDGYVFLSLGTIGGLFFFGLALHERILSAYNERDFLRGNLESEVERKTILLRNKTEELEGTMKRLKAAQGELVQSEKLASLGTLAAGIAHEINNALNYVNGALRPLEKIVLKNIEKKDEETVKKLTNIMKDGLHLTFEIIKSLKHHSGINRSEKSEVKVLETIESVKTILRTRLRDKFEFIVNVDEELIVSCNVAGLNQIIMNLVTNSLDAMPVGGVITVSAYSKGDFVCIEVRDTGEGIPENVADKIFDPFFTTKDVGKGTGLGLHIVKSEIEQQGGSISLSTNEKGTTFILEVPSPNKGSVMEAA